MMRFDPPKGGEDFGKDLFIILSLSFSKGVFFEFVVIFRCLKGLN